MVARSTPDPSVSLAARLARPQRHRLLHGFPMAPLMVPHPTGRPPIPRSDRPLLVGVLPHPYCNPTVTGCGFCTFPHERYVRSRTRPLADALAREIAWRAPDLAGRRVVAVYVGGGTANLVPPDAFEIVAQALGRAFDLGDAELTLEGAPAYFGLHDAAVLERCRRLRPRRLRISMGVQTFDEGWLERMGRLGFAAPHHVDDALAVARRVGAGTSCDLLIGLPGQPVEAMLADVRHAARLGFDQVSVYPLVLRADFPVPWARDAGLLAGLPDPEAGYAAWREVRAALLREGYVQRTLTNFERASLGEVERFAYEPWSFRPDTCDAVGFGPGAISGFGHGTGRGEKWLAEGGAEAWLARMRDERPVARHFAFSAEEDALAVLTRRLALLSWDDAPPTTVARFTRELAALEDAGLVELGPRRVSLTERGTYFADAVAGLLAERTIERHRAGPQAHDPSAAHMG